MANFSLLEILKELNSRKKDKLIRICRSEDELIKHYDDCNITILPSYTEAHPYVLEESLARKRPILIFEDISYVKKDKYGVFVIKRNLRITFHQQNTFFRKLF